ncbi:hypothetical protein PIROE2DRAFT_63719 [Piromyces sp. E2]|nr:hypothetical protein PIROE2DRAFT_63719 [Piromyces sp. E2]|eukprot:OUM59529.1 hypothetical protein PIROE2DRAFT_63719 [Piromyces sp. E2]
MRKIIAIFINDVKEIFKRPAVSFILLGLIFLPGMYSWLNIDSTWNPYDNTGNLPIAIVNKDKGATILGENINMGNSLVDGMKENNAIKWFFLNEAEAKEKVLKSEIYGEVDIPEDFSKNIINIFEIGQMKRPELSFQVNQKKNAIAPIIVSKAVNALETTIDQNIVNAIFYKGLGTANTVKLFTKEFNSTSGITEKLNVGKEGISDLKSLFKVLKLISDSTSNSISAIRDLLPTVDSLTGTTKDGMSNLKGTMNSLKSLSETIENVVASIENESKEILDIANSINLDKQRENKELISSKVDIINSKLTENRRRIKNVQDFLSKVSEHIQLRGINLLQNQLDKIVAEIDDIQTIISNNRETENDIKNINNKLKNIQIKEKDVQKAYKNDIKNNLNSAFDNSSKSMDIVSNLFSDLDGATKNADSALASLMKIFGNTKDLTENIDNVCTKLENDIGKVIDSLSEPQKSDLFDKFANLIQNDPMDLANFLSTPVQTNKVDMYGLDKNGSQLSYGSKMTPFFTTLSCWIGCVFLVTIVRTNIINIKKKEKFKNYQKFFGRFIIFAIVAILQGFVLAIGNLLIKVQAKHPFYFILSIMNISFVFVFIVYSLTVSFGRVGEGLSVIVLVLQIAGSGGSFPIEMLPKAYQIAQPIMPFYPALNLIRESICGFYGNNYIEYTLMLWCHTIIPFLLGIIFRTPLIHMLENIEKELEKTAMII